MRNQVAEMVRFVIFEPEPLLNTPPPPQRQYDKPGLTDHEMPHAGCAQPGPLSR
jgi:hypothetical protein